MNYKTRCPWIQQNDANGQAPFLCGPAVVQMILYGQDSSKFKLDSDELRDEVVEDLNKDQQQIWAAIKDNSQELSLDGIEYLGNPEWRQIVDPALFWATFPEALAETLTKGVVLESGDVKGVPVTVQRLSLETGLVEAIVASLKRDAPVALLIKKVHWVALYGFRDDDPGEFYYCDGLHSRMGATRSDFLDLLLDAQVDGVYKDTYVAVTGTSREADATDARRAITPTKMRFHRRSTQEHGGLVGPRPCPPGLGEALATELAKDDEWKPTFENAKERFVLRVKGPTGRFYYLFDYNDAAHPRKRIGSIIVDGYTHRRMMSAGVERLGQSLPKFVGPHEVQSTLDTFHGNRVWFNGTWMTLDTSKFVVDESSVSLELIWQPCDQSVSPFLPFYVVRYLAPGGLPRVWYLRSDGKLFPELTSTMAGI